MYGTQASDGVSGFHNKLQNHDNIATRGKKKEVCVSQRESILNGKSNINSINELNWKVDFNISGSFPGSVSLSGAADVSHKNESGRATFRDRSENDEGMLEGYEMVVE